MSCQETTAANKVKTEPDPGTMQSVDRQQEIPKEEDAVLLDGGLRKLPRDRDLVAGPRQKPKGRIQQAANPG
jgi:hypothetical protein